jgi:hypothetical protein
LGEPERTHILRGAELDRPRWYFVTLAEISHRHEYEDVAQ